MFFGMGKAIVLFLRNRYFSSTHTLELLISKEKGSNIANSSSRCPIACYRNFFLLTLDGNC